MAQKSISLSNGNYLFERITCRKDINKTITYLKSSIEIGNVKAPKLFQLVEYIQSDTQIKIYFKNHLDENIFLYINNQKNKRFEKFDT